MKQLSWIEKKSPNYAFMKKQTFKSLTELNTELNILLCVAVQS